MTSIKHNIQKIYLYNFFHGLIFAYVIERLFWASRGMSVADVVWIEIIYSMTVVGFELPTGMIADRFSRKQLLIIDAILSFFEFAIIIYATSFIHFAIAILLSGLGHALQSGAHNALVYDTLKASGDEEDFEKVLGRINFFDYLGIIIAGLIGAFLASQYPYVLTYYLSLISLGLGFLVCMTIVEVKTTKDEEAWKLSDWKAIVNFTIHNKNILVVTIVGVVSGASINYIDEFWQIYLEAVHVPVTYFGIVSTLGFGAVALGGLVVERSKERLGFAKSLTRLLFLCSFSLLFVAISRDFKGIIGIMVVYFAYAIVEPLIYGYLHKHAIEKYRATIESFYSMITYLAIAIVGLPFGYISTSYGIFNGMLYLTGIVMITMVIIIGLRKWIDE